MTDIRIVGDWGSTRLRLWRIADGEVTDRLEGPGIIGLGRAPADMLMEQLAAWQADGIRRLTLCGMAGARGGLREACYSPCPASADQWALAAIEFPLDSLSVRIAAGCAFDSGGGLRDLMRGEETQIFGAMQVDPALATGRHMLVLPGTHSKWVWIEEGSICGFRTFLTGELFARLHGSSLLSAEVEGAAPSLPGGDDTGGFATGLLAAARSDGGLLGSLFLTRSAQVDGGRSPAWAAAFLSGMLIGAECAEMGRSDGLSPPVRILGAPGLAERYATALAHFGEHSVPLDADRCTLAGLALVDAGH